MMNMRRTNGFSLIELIIVVGIIGILAMIAYPSFLDAGRKARRSDAMDAITSIRIAQEKFRANCIEYARELDDSSDTCDDADATNNEVRHSATSANGYYSLDIDVITGRPYSVAYKITATAEGDQQKDSCGDFILEVDSGSAEKSTSVYTDHTSDQARRCWKR